MSKVAVPGSINAIREGTFIKENSMSLEKGIVSRRIRRYCDDGCMTFGYPNNAGCLVITDCRMSGGMYRTFEQLAEHHQYNRLTGEMIDYVIDHCMKRFLDMCDQVSIEVDDYYEALSRFPSVRYDDFLKVMKNVMHSDWYGGCIGYDSVSVNMALYAPHIGMSVIREVTIGDIVSYGCDLIEGSNDIRGVIGLGRIE